MKKLYLSLIIPVFNEEKNIVPLFKEIKASLKKINYFSEIIFVDDGSSDQTFSKLQTLKGVKIIQLRKNCGQSSALDAGIKNSQGKILITMDGDGQNDPRDIPKLLKKLNQGFDVVCGWRHQRQDPLFKNLVSQGAFLLGKFLVDPDVHDSGCTLRAYKRQCFEHLNLYGEMHRMIPGLLKWQGFKIGEIKVNHRPRKFGQSKYSWKRIIKGFLDMVYVWFWRKYKTRPMHLFGTIGIILTFFGSLLLIVLAWLKISYQYQLSDKIWPLVGFSSIIMGGQFFCFGILASNSIENQAKKGFYQIKKIFKK